MIEEKTKIYIAGLIDRSCSISIRTDNTKQKYGTYHSVQIVLSSRLEIVEFLQNLYGGSISQKKNSKTSYRLTITNKKARKLIEDIQPYIKFKKEHFKLCVDLFKLPLTTDRIINEDIRKEREKIRIKMCELNLQKGYGKSHIPTSELLKN